MEETDALARRANRALQPYRGVLLFAGGAAAIYYGK
jgi:hypothetical protein